MTIRNYMTSYDFGQQLSEILGIPSLTNVDLHFPLDGVVSADVQFLLSDVQAKAVLNLMSDGKWKTPNLPAPTVPIEGAKEFQDVDVTTMDTTSHYRTTTVGRPIG